MATSSIKPVIRLARPGEGPVVLAVLRAAFAEQATTIEPPPGVLIESIDDVERAIDDGLTIVALVEGVIAGTARCAVRSDALYLGRLGVLPVHRGTGLAARIVRFAAFTLAEHTGRQRIEINVRDRLPGNLAFFEGLGFVRTGQHSHERNQDAQVVSRALPLNRSNTSG